MAGFDAPYVPGWDCHGLPIELKVDRELGAAQAPDAAWRTSAAPAAPTPKFVDLQRERLQAPGRARRLGRSLPDDELGYEAAIVRALGRFVEQGLVYQGKKPVHWCIHCRTALAEAEVEYEVAQLAVDLRRVPAGPVEPEADLAARLPALAGRAVSALIWTTTPWTIPANLAIAFHPDFEYGAYETGRRAWSSSPRPWPNRSRRPTGRKLVRAPPWHDDRSDHSRACASGIRSTTARRVAVLADYVTLEQGTGVVHTAPGHGADDFHTGVRYGLDIYAPVDAGGHFTDDVGLFAGQRVFDANPSIEAALAERGRLWHRETFEHSYPHCWRCHNPVIFLATAQWFIAMDRDGFRQPGARRGQERDAGCRPGATIGSRTWWRTGPTGASRASAPGACRSRRSTAPSAARRS